MKPRNKRRTNSCSYLIRKHVWRLIHSLLVRCVWNFTKALKGVWRTLTASPLDHKVVVLLTMFYVTDRDGTTRLHDRAAEQALIISTVRYHLHGHRYGTRAFSPATQTQLKGSNMVENLTYIVTFEGSPPNAEMYFCTHLNARRS